MYSQNNEDDFLLEFFKEKTDGLLMEIGAYDSKALSNSKALIEKGWSAYLVDASPFCASKFFEVYKENKKINIIQSIITKEQQEGLISFWEAPFSAVSSTIKGHTKKYHPSEEEFENKTKEIFLTSVSINNLLKFIFEREGKLDFLSIDVEGYSAELALAMDLNILLPSCICIEHDSQQERLLEHFSKFGYKKEVFNGENLIITR